MTPAETAEFWTLAQQFNRRVDKGRPKNARCGAMTGAVISLAVEAAAAALIVAAIILL